MTRPGQFRFEIQPGATYSTVVACKLARVTP
jgi:hypothetical protein